MGALSYLKDTIRGKIQPNKVSQLLWGVAPLIAFSAEISQGVRIQALTTFIVGFIPFRFQKSLVNNLHNGTAFRISGIVKPNGLFFASKIIFPGLTILLSFSKFNSEILATGIIRLGS